MSDLSRWRARWIRIEKRLIKLEAELADLDVEDEAYESALVTGKIAEYVEKLERTKALVHGEELRLMDADSMLVFSVRKSG